MKEESIWVMDFPNQLIREKVMMEPPELVPEYTDHDLMLNQDNLVEYEKHIASRRTFPYPVSKEQDGKEIPESEFRLQHQTLPIRNDMHSVYMDCNEHEYNSANPDFRRIIAIPIDNIGETDRQYEEGLPDQKDGNKMISDFINSFQVSKKLKYGIACSIQADLASLGIDLSDNKRQKYQDKNAENLVNEVLDNMLNNLPKILSSPPDPASNQNEEMAKRYFKAGLIITNLGLEVARLNELLDEQEHIKEGMQITIDNLIDTKDSLSEPSGKEQENDAVCSHCGDIIEHPLCRNCEIALTLPDKEY